MDPDFTSLLQTLGQQNNLPAGLLPAVLNTESGMNPNAISPKGAQGIAQFMPQTAAQYGVNPNDPRSSAQGAAKMLGDLLKQTGGNVDKTLADWNWGQGNVARKGMENMPAETRGFIQKVKTGMGGQDGQVGQAQGPKTVDYQGMVKGLEGQTDAALAKYQSEEDIAKQKMADIEAGMPQAAQQAQIPAYKPKPLVDPDQFQQFSSAMMVMAALGGAMSHGKGYGWIATTDALNSALQGFAQGSMEQYKKGVDDYNRQYQEAMKQQEAYNTQFKEALESKNIAIRQQMMNIEMASRDYGNTEAAIAAKKGDIFKLLEMQSKQEDATEKLKLQHEKMQIMMGEKALDREAKMQQIHEKAGQLKDLPAVALGKLAAMNQSTVGLKEVIDDAKTDPELLKATFNVPFWKDAEKFQMAVKAGQLPSLMTPQKTDLVSETEYQKQVDYWRHVSSVVERYAVATSPSRAFGVLQFFQSIKPQSSDAPALAMAGFERFYKESQNALKMWADSYSKNPAHKGQMDAFLEGTGVTVDGDQHQGEKIVDFRSLK
jgi:hypothetical protein